MGMRGCGAHHGNTLYIPPYDPLGYPPAPLMAGRIPPVRGFLAAV